MYNTIEKPAASIRELTLYLMANHQDDFVYRGQIKDYGQMVPSLFRNVPLKKVGDYFHFPKDFETKPLEKLRATFISVLMDKFGNIVGNYLAQQYLARSGCIDITSRVDIAAFFATMSYPDYTHCLNANEELGVIYRFNSKVFENRLKPTGAKPKPFGATDLNNDHRVFQDLSSVSHTKRQKNSEDEYYQLTANITTFVDIEPFLDDIDTNDATYHGRTNNDFSHFKRPRFQHGGMIQPAYLYESAEIDTNDFVGFEDIYQKYGMTTYYFRHCGHTPRYKREEIWPVVAQDGTFATLYLLAKQALLQFNAYKEISITDIVDSGYAANLPKDI